jgi:hypothetical protein
MKLPDLTKRDANGSHPDHPKTQPFHQTAQRYLAAGWSGVLPMGGKIPLVEGHHGGKGQPDGTSAQIQSWRLRHPGANIALRLPPDVVGLDVDAYEGKQGGATLAALEAELGPLPPTWVSTSKDDGVSGIRLYRVPAGERRYTAQAGTHLDVLHHGNRYAVVAPSVHPRSGGSYSWRLPDTTTTHRVPRPDELAQLPPAWLAHITRPELAVAAANGHTPGGTRLSDLLALPPEHPDRGNDWLSRVAGHYAAFFGDKHDLYLASCATANAVSADPVCPADFDKTVNSIWEAEHAKPVPAATPDETNGWLVGDGSQLRTPVESKDGETWLGQWADFDLQATGVVEEDGKDRVYDLTLTRQRDGAQISTLLPAKTLADPKATAAFLANYGAALTTPGGNQKTRTRDGARLLRYIEAQDPPRFQVVPCLGWHGEGFLCHEGVITAAGLAPHAGVKPATHLVSRAPYHYGFVDERLARDTLRQVLTFHDETVAAVFGAWWAACLLKPQIAARYSQFPIMALEATSEAGKTTGMFALLIQLSGCTEGQAVSTRAAMTRALGDHNAAPVWIDDANDLDDIDELLRAATSKGYRKKMAEDRESVVVEELVAPILLSGETLGATDQKAMADRQIRLAVPSPVDRRSLLNPAVPQWEDIKALRQRHPALSAMAGNMVQMAARAAPLVDQFGAGETSGRRSGHKLAVTAIGARILSQMTGDETWTARVDAWAADAGQHRESFNSMVEKVIPEYLAREGAQSRPMPAQASGVPSPVLVVREGEHTGVWYHPLNLAIWWSSLHRSARVTTRTETAAAFEQQRQTLGATPDWRVRTPDQAARLRYWRLPDPAAQVVLDRAEG